MSEKPKDGVYTEYYHDGQLKKREIYKEGRLNGLYEIWYKNGQLLECATYKNGKLDGLWEAWHKNGQLWSRSTYKEGRLVLVPSQINESLTAIAQQNETNVKAINIKKQQPKKRIK